MAARRKKTRHGATQPEAERKNKQLLLRWSEDQIAVLERIAELHDCSKSEMLWSLVEDALNQAYPLTECEHGIHAKCAECHAVADKERGR